MANTNAPYGFLHDETVGGGAPTFAQQAYPIATDYTSTMFYGDPVTQDTSGNLVRGTTNGLIIGVFVGCYYTPSAPNGSNLAFSRMWPGSAATNGGGGVAMVISDPNARFRVQASGANIPRTDIGANFTFTFTTGNTLSGVSACTLTSGSAATTATYPFRLIDIVGSVNGNDPTDSYNDVIVAFNNQSFKQLTGVA